MSYLLALAGIIITTVYYWGIQAIPQLSMGDPLGPRAFPQLLCIAMLFSCLLLLLEGRKKMASRPALSGSFTPVLAALVVIALYFIGFKPLGYVVDTTLFLLLTMGWCHPKRRQAVTVAILFPIASWYLFRELLDVPLPGGLLFS